MRWRGGGGGELFVSECASVCVCVCMCVCNGSERASG